MFLNNLSAHLLSYLKNTERFRKRIKESQHISLLELFSAPPLYQNYSLGHSVCSGSAEPRGLGSFQAFSFWSLFSEDLQHWKLLLIPLFWRFRASDAPWFLPVLFSNSFADCSSSSQTCMLESFIIYSWFIFPTSSVCLSLSGWSHQFPQPSVFICSQFLKLYPQLRALFWTTALLDFSTWMSHRHFRSSLC